MARTMSPQDCTTIVAIQQLQRTLAAHALTAARAAEQQAEDRHKVLEQQAQAHLTAWSSYVGSGLLDPDALQRMGHVIVDDARATALAVTDLNRLANVAIDRANQLAFASANVKQAEAMTRKAMRQAGRKAEELAMRALEERHTIARRSKR